MSPTTSQVPAHPVPVPEPLRAVLARHGAPPGATELPAVWVNDLGGTTFALHGPGGAVFCKWAPAGVALDLPAEVARARWARRWLPVPQVLETGSAPQGSWLVSRALPGSSAVDPRWRSRPEVAVPALGRALRRFHDTLPVEQCPFDWQVPFRLQQAVGPTGGLLDPPPVDRLVVCHGDACSPNTLLADTPHTPGDLAPGAASAEAVAWVDLSGLGVADRWADLAVATLALRWNYRHPDDGRDEGPGGAEGDSGWEPVFLQAYGIGPDPVRTAYYRALWNVGP